MNCTIDSICAQNFRGIRRIELLLKGRNLIIVGENGAGKSSIVDAVEYAFTGRVEQLEGRADVNAEQSIRNFKGGPTEIELTFKGQAAETSVTLAYPRDEHSIPASLRPLFDLAARRRFILRRSQVLRFIDARGTGRYEQVSEIVGLGRLDKMDKHWRGQCNAARKEVEELHGDRQGTLRRIGDLLGQQVAAEEDILAAVNTRLGDFDLPPVSGRESLEQCRETLRGRSRIETDISTAEKLRSLQGSAQGIAEGISEVLSQYDALCHSIDAFWKQSEVLEDASFEQLLTQGYRVLQERSDLSSCPLCEEPFRDRDALLRRMDERLHKLRTLTQSRREIDQQRNGVENKLAVLGNMLTSLRRDLETRGFTETRPLIESALHQMHAWQAALGNRDWKPADAEKWQQPSAITKLQHRLPPLIRELQEQALALTPNEEEKSLLDFLLELTRVDEQWQTLQQKSLELEKARYVGQQIDKVYGELIEARKQGVERLLQELETDFDLLYQQLHPNEGYEGVSIPVERSKRSSIALRARFQGQEETHPLSYYSDGHLDSLGLCIFLAFIKRFNRDLKLVVLDDVLTTVDAGHRLRVARLLAREFEDYQFMITTHDQLWAKELERAIPNTRLVQLRKWNLEQGVDCQQNILSDWEYYEQQALNGRPQDTIAGAGRNLEKFLSQMRGNLGLKVPAKRDRNYTIGDLYDPFFAWVNKSQLERADRPEFAAELKALQKELDEVWRLRNWSGAHFNEWAATVTPDEALSFLDAIKSLVTSFECPVCGNLVVYDSNAKVVICPYCEPSPPPHAVSEYEPDWHDKIIKLLQVPNKKVRRNVAPMAQGVCQSFLRDMRRRLDFPLLATPDDQYTMAQLYTPFFEWAAAHPRPELPDWQQAIEERKQALDTYWQADQWVDVTDAELESFVEAVQGLTTLFECGTCSQLLNYNYEQETYFCAECSGQPTIPSKVSAYWFVKRN